jgi:DinB superfamily
MHRMELLALVIATLPWTASGRDLKTALVQHWKTSKEFTLAVAEAMPADGYDFKPNPEEMTFGALMIHIGDEISHDCAAAARTQPLSMPNGNGTRFPAPRYSKEVVLKFLNESYDKCVREVESISPDQFDVTVYKYQGAEISALEALWYGFTQASHHRGQAEVYLRVKNIKPPAYRF